MLRLLAVARNTFLEAIRTRVTAVFIVLLAVAILSLPMMSGHGTLIERMQTYLAYSLGLTIFLLSVLTLLLGCGLFCGEIRKRQIFAPLTKPVARWQYLLGRWLGVVSLQTLLCFGAGAAIYTMVYYLKDRIPDPQQQAILNDQLLVGRARIFPTPIDFNARVEARMQQLAKDNRLQPAIDAEGGQELGKQKVYQQVLSQVMVESQTAQPLGILNWQFTGLQRPSSPDALVQFSLLIAPSTPPPDAKLNLVCRFENPTDKELFFWGGEIASKVKTVISLPAKCIGSDGRLTVYLQNMDPRDPGKTFPTSITILAGDVSILYPVSGFTANFFRGILGIFFTQVFLASLAMVAASFLSFPVAALLCFGMTIIGMGASFIQASTSVAGFWATLGHYASVAVLFLMPNFATASPTDALVGGVAIPWTRVLVIFVTFVLIQSSLTLGLACLIFRRRELAQMTA